MAFGFPHASPWECVLLPLTQPLRLVSHCNVCPWSQTDYTILTQDPGTKSPLCLEIQFYVSELMSVRVKQSILMPQTVVVIFTFPNWASLCLSVN